LIEMTAQCLNRQTFHHSLQIVAHAFLLPMLLEVFFKAVSDVVQVVKLSLFEGSLKQRWIILQNKQFPSLLLFYGHAGPVSPGISVHLMCHLQCFKIEELFRLCSLEFYFERCACESSYSEEEEHGLWCHQLKHSHADLDFFPLML
jgi:hypothetical protein